MMNKRNYLVFSGVVFGVVAALHLLRVFKDWVLIVGGYTIPLWVSWAAVFMAGFLAWQAYKLNN